MSQANEIGLKFWKSLGFEVISKRDPQQLAGKPIENPCCLWDVFDLTPKKWTFPKSR
jgi:hypothetical protein